MGYHSSLQVLKNGGKSFKKVSSSNINDGDSGTIFQANNGDLYAMGNGSKLEVLKNGEDNFKVVGSSNINDGYWGTIFQTSNGDLYAMGNGSKLQVLKNGEDNFEVVGSSNINDGYWGTIFQTSNGDLYAMGNGSKLQVLKNNLEFEITSQTSSGTSDGIIKAKNFINHYSKLQYKNNLASEWISIPPNGQIINLALGTYNFRWVSKNGETYKDNSHAVNLPDQTIKTFAIALIEVNVNIKKVTDETATTPTNKKIVKYRTIPSSNDLNVPTQNGFSFTFKSATPINDVGTSNVIYSVDVHPKIVGTTTKDITFTISGFQSKADAISEANLRIKTVTDETVTLPTKNKVVKHGIVPTKDDLNVPTQNGFFFTFKRATPINDAGQSSITYIVNINPTIVGTTTKDIIFTISGFQSKVDAISEANLRIKAVTDETITLPTKNKVVKHGIVPTKDDINVPTQNGFSFTFKRATPINDVGTSNVIYSVDVHPKIVGTTTKDITFTISGFQSKADAISEANLRIKAVTDETVTLPTKNKVVKHGIVPTKDDLNVPTQNDFSFTFKRATPINDVGTSNVIYSVDVHPKIIGTTTKDIIFTISGFQSKVDAISEANLRIKAVTDETITLPTKNKVVKHGIVPTKDDLNVPTQNDFSFTFKRATPINDVGTSNVIYSVDVHPKIVGTTTKDITFTISGFQSKADAISEANLRIKAVTDETVTLPTKNKVVKHGIVPTKDDLNVPTQNGFSFTFKRATSINDAGTSNVIYTVDVHPKIIGTTTKDIIFEVSGFETKVKTNNQKIILATTIPIGLISLVAIIWLTKHFFFKGQKKHKT